MRSGGLFRRLVGTVAADRGMAALGLVGDDGCHWRASLPSRRLPKAEVTGSNPVNCGSDRYCLTRVPFLTTHVIPSSRGCVT